ncbi:MAG: hypothetical protein AMJ79_05075 [Phycisphaerae bacterium SM23_30]|nr:MAG: hypothetical protein AMJ79_05075 [Phycisphaerae bacterium SM23_30]
MQKTEILIIGAGVIGICAAYYLTEKGYKVTVVDKGEVCSGCSYGNVGVAVPSICGTLASPGIISKSLKWLLDPESPFYIKPRFNRDLIGWLWEFQRACNEPQMRRGLSILHEFNTASVELFKDLAAQEKMDFGFVQKGLLVVFKSLPGFKEGVQEAELRQKIGIEAEIIRGSELRSFAPHLRSGLAGGIYYRRDAHLDPYKFVRRLAEKTRKKGAQILTSTEVIGFEIFGKAIKTVETTRGDFTADEVVLAAGAWSSEMSRYLGLKLPIQAAKGYSITYRLPENYLEMPVSLSETKVFITPLADTLRLGGTLELAGMDLSINKRRVNAILKTVPEYIDINIENLKLIEIWRGLRPCTPDGLPFLGRCRAINNFIVAAGHAMEGISLGPVTGQLVAQVIGNEKPSVDLSLMSIERFN